MLRELNSANAYIFRITHRANLRWILQNGLFCAASEHVDPNFVSIGNPDLIERRAERLLPPPFPGTLSQYVPFYFTPFSPMMYNIHTGRGVPQRANEDIIIIVSSLPKLQESGVRFAFTDRHAYLQAATFYDDPARLDQLDWDRLRDRDFKNDPNDPAKFERYQAEALAYGHVPVAALLGIACHNQTAHASVTADMAATGVAISARIWPSWYF